MDNFMNVIDNIRTLLNELETLSNPFVASNHTRMIQIADQIYTIATTTNCGSRVLDMFLFEIVTLCVDVRDTFYIEVSDVKVSSADWNWYKRVLLHPDTLYSYLTGQWFWFSALEILYDPLLRTMSNIYTVCKYYTFNTDHNRICCGNGLYIPLSFYTCLSIADTYHKMKPPK